MSNNITSLNINGVDYNMGINMAPCKLVGGATGIEYTSRAGMYSPITLSTTDFDFLRLIMYKYDDNGGYFEFSFLIPNNGIKYLCPILNSDIPYFANISDNKLYIKEYDNDIPTFSYNPMVELYKYI